MSMPLKKSVSASAPAETDDIDEAAEAERQAQRIRAYWAARGRKVRVWTEISSDKDGSAAHWIVRSDLVAGRPRPDQQKEAAIIPSRKNVT